MDINKMSNCTQRIVLCHSISANVEWFPVPVFRTSCCTACVGVNLHDLLKQLPTEKEQSPNFIGNNSRSQRIQ